MDIILDNVYFESIRKRAKKDILLCHININSKSEELTTVIKKLSAHIIFISEANIDASFPNSQFSIPGYLLHRHDRKKGGEGIMAFISSSLTSKRVKLERNYKTFEPLALKIKTDDKKNITSVGI